MTTPPRAATASFADEAHRQSLAVAQSRHDREDQDFIDAISADEAGDGAHRRASSATRRAASGRGNKSQ